MQETLIQNIDIVNQASLDESLILEKNRQELINKSRNADNYTRNNLLIDKCNGRVICYDKKRERTLYKSSK